MRKRVSGNYAVGIDVAWSRSHTAVVTAGYIDNGGGAIALKVAEYLPGPDTVETILAKLVEDKARIHRVVMDMKSPAVRLVEPIEKGIRRGFYRLETVQDYMVAHHTFYDEFIAGRIHHDGHPAFATALQYVDVRLLGGTEVVDRRKSAADTSPLTASQMAVFGLVRLKKERPPRIYT